MSVEHLYELAPIAHFEIDLHGTITEANDTCILTFGRSRRDFLGRNLEDLFGEGPTGIEAVRRLLRRFRGHEEVAFTTVDGADRWGQMFIWPVESPDRVTTTMHVVVLDITAHRKLELELEESEARFRTLGDSAPVMLWMAGLDGRCTFFNKQWLEFTGRPLSEEVGDGWAELVHPEDFQHCMDTFLSGFVARKTFRMEYRLKRVDGEYRWILDTGLPRYLPDRSFAGFIGSCVDITEFKEANDALRALKRQLEGRVSEAREAILARDEFLSIASHELRTPLSVLVLQLGVLQKSFQETKTQAISKLTGKVERAAKAATRLTTLVDSLLDVSRIATGRLQLRPEECDLAEIVHELLERFGETARRAGCEIRNEVATSVRGVWDRVRVEQVLDNLISNAMKYGPAKPIDIRIASQADLARIEIRDQGIGIGSADLDRIFGRFERAVPSHSYGGLGLGLYITRQIVEAHGGTIGVSSELGSGAAFVVELPRWKLSNEHALRAP